MSSLILTRAAEKITRFDEMGLHYNLVAGQIYEKRRGTGPFDESFLRYIVAGLISFDIGRMMGREPYETEGNSFTSRLRSKLQVLRPLLKPLMNLDLAQMNLEEHRNVIIKAYRALSDRGALHMDPEKSFHVGATKILHFLNPKLFIIVDSNATRAFKEAHNVPCKYGANRYTGCMKYAQKDILAYGLDKFKALEPRIPITRIYDKLTFVTGYDLRRKKS